MLFQRMAVKLSFSVLILWTTAVTLGRAATLSLSSEITGFIPQCALLCFESFLEANLLLNSCGESPSLQCLCSRTGSSGFTIGEGAVQCIVAENHVGACSGMDASSQVVANAYQMCNGQLSAARETHATIVATLILPTQTGPVIVPDPTSTSTSTLTSTSVTTSRTTEVPTSISWITMSADPTPSTDRASSADWAPTTSLSNASPNSSQPSSSPSPSPSPSSSPSAKGQLSTAVIAGIAAGGTAAVLLAVVLILVLRCTHRKKTMLLDNEKSGFSRMRDSWGSPKQLKGGPSPNIPQISAPRYQEPEPMEYTRALANNNSSGSPRLGARPETIGLAISAGGANGTGGDGNASMPLGSPPTYVSPKRPPQTPPKPSLTLAIPPKAVVRGSPPQPPRMPFNDGRDSVVTEFAEDGEVDPASAGGAQIWRPPASDPQSATAYYVADRWGNWVLNNSKRQSQAVEVARAGRTTGGDKSAQAPPPATSAPPNPPPASALPARPPQVRLVLPEDPRLRSSSVYSNYSLPQTVTPGPPQSRQPSLPGPPPDPEAYYSSFGGRRRSSGGGGSARGGDPRRKSRGAPQRSDTMASHDSVTTIASSASGTLDGEDAAYAYEPQGPPPNGNSLSPVVESPQSGHSPVTYPTIPRPRSRMFGRERAAAATGGDAANPARLPPPPVKYEYHPPGQPSPTLGLANSVAAIQGTPQASAPRRPGLNPNPNRDPGQVRTGSPNVPQQGDQGPQQQQQQQQQQQPGRQHPSLSARKATPRPDAQDGQRPQPARERTPTLNAFPLPPTGAPAPPVAGGGGGDPFFTLQSQYAQQQQPQQQQPQPQQQQPQPQRSATPTSTHSNASSLLAKRLGSERAAALALADHQQQQQQHGRGKWKRQSRAGGAGTPRRAAAAAAGGEREFSFVEQEDGGDGGRVQLPATPGWLPKLTPTRRGDELFLSVQ